MQDNRESFYTQLPVSRLPLPQLLLREDLFAAVPESWHVIITDIKKSTSAVQTGLHENVNLVATGSIVTVLNIAFKLSLAVPFFFGGDGASFIVPSSLMKLVMPALAAYQQRTRENFNLELRIGQVAVQDIYANGHALAIAKFGVSAVFPIPVLLGNGLQYAESLIKADDYFLPVQEAFTDELDLNGMQCRWDRIPPPDNQEEVITLLVMSRQSVAQRMVFSQIMQEIDTIYGTPDNRQPISISKLRLATTFNRLGREMRAGIGRIKYAALLYEWLYSLLGPFYFSTQKGKQYLASLVAMADTLVLDGRINTVMSGTQRQRLQLQQLLETRENAGEILFGLHVSNSSIMSCYVRDMKDGHIHFVDGADGGYTRAASLLKQKIKNLPEPR
ncbi:MAG TPA: DUF3095 family protein [Chitinophagaceae bacterium]|nr:DUF3095 family protein [Chitinophagaceae bacterium]